MIDESARADQNQFEFLDVTADPFGDKNPFTADDPRHVLWSQATRVTEESIANIAERMSKAYTVRLETERRRIQDEISRYGHYLTPISMSPLLVTYYRFAFDAWSGRNLAAIAGDRDLATYDGWLKRHAQKWLELTENSDAPDEIKRPLVFELNIALREGIAHGVSESRKYLRTVIAAAEAKTLGHELVPAAAPSPVASPKEAEPQIRPLKKRGRPQTIPVERKISAADLKASGGTNKQVAALLYNTSYPTDQQRKNVPAILKNHSKTSKPNTTRG